MKVASALNHQMILHEKAKHLKLIILYTAKSIDGCFDNKLKVTSVARLMYHNYLFTVYTVLDNTYTYQNT